ncbi:MAG: hypothetical protein AAF940_00155 [Pseudomonadota bacterium]
MNLAQTNLQLYQQLRDAGFTADELSIIQRDNETACLLFGSNIRSSGKSFLCHAVGTASAAAHAEAEFDAIRCAFLHAAYKHGRFPNGTRGKTPAHRQWLTPRVGPKVEDMIFRFGSYPFGIPVVRALVTSGNLDGQDKTMLLLKLCNEIDDTYCYGALLGHKSRYKDTHYLADLAAVSTMAGYAGFAAHFSTVQAQMKDAGWLDATTEFDRRPFKRNSLFEVWRALNGKR